MVGLKAGLGRWGGPVRALAAAVLDDSLDPDTESVPVVL
jgi:hypothetical protein